MKGMGPVASETGYLGFRVVGFFSGLRLLGLSALGFRVLRV